MQVLFLSNFFPPSRSWGYTQLCHEVFTELRHRGHDVAVITSNYEAHLAPNDEQGVYRLLYLDSDPFFYRPLSFLYRSRFQYRQNLAALKKITNAVQPDIVFIWGMWNLSKNLPAFFETLDVPVVYYLADHWPTFKSPHEQYWSSPARHGILQPIKGLLNKAAMKLLMQESGNSQLRFEHAICVSKFLRESLVVKGIPVQQAAIIHNGIGPGFTQIAHLLPKKRVDGRLRLIYAGRLEYDKGPHTAIESMACLVNTQEAGNISLTILGAGHPGYEFSLIDLVSHHALNDLVTFHKRLSRDELPEFLRRFDVLVFPSICEEALPRMPQEAMACGLVVIGTTIGGTQELLIEGETGLTFAPGDAQGLARQISWLNKDPGQFDRLVEAGRNKVLEQFTLERMVNEIESYLSAVLHTKYSADKA